MHKVKTQKGITIVALVITIIVMLILVGVSVTVALNGELFTTAQQAVNKTQLQLDKEQLLSAVIGAINKEGIVEFGELDNNLPEGFQSIEEGIYTSKAGNTFIVSENGEITLVVKNEESGDSGTIPETPRNNIPEGATYYVGVTSTTLGDYTGAAATFTAGDEFPVTVNTGDVYVYDGYEYRYNQYWDEIWNDDNTQNGWGIRVLDTSQSTYGTILEILNGEQVTSMLATFYECASLTTAPAIPDGVTDMSYTFTKCTSLTDISDLVIPNSVTTMYCTFSSCSALVNAGIVIPESVTDMYSTFYKCTSLTEVPDMSNATGLDNMLATFSYCTALTDVSGLVIPNSVTTLRETFFGCTSLTGTISINATPKIYDYCFSAVDMSKITLAGSCSATLKQSIANTGKNGSQVTIID